MDSVDVEVIKVRSIKSRPFGVSFELFTRCKCKHNGDRIVSWGTNVQIRYISICYSYFLTKMIVTNSDAQVLVSYFVSIKHSTSISVQLLHAWCNSSFPIVFICLFNDSIPLDWNKVKIVHSIHSSAINISFIYWIWELRSSQNVNTHCYECVVFQF